MCVSLSIHLHAFMSVSYVWLRILKPLTKLCAVNRCTYNFLVTSNADVEDFLNLWYGDRHCRHLYGSCTGYCYYLDALWLSRRSLRHVLPMLATEAQRRLVFCTIHTAPVLRPFAFTSLVSLHHGVISSLYLSLIFGFTLFDLLLFYNANRLFLIGIFLIYDFLIYAHFFWDATRA